MKRGRTSIAASVIPLPASSRLLEPPDYLEKDEAAMFCEVIASCPPSQFTASDIPMLVSYVQASLQARKSLKIINAKNAKPTSVTMQLWDRAVRQQAMLATKLRLAPNSRTDPKSLSRKIRNHQPSAYDTMELEDD